MSWSNRPAEANENIHLPVKELHLTYRCRRCDEPIALMGDYIAICQPLVEKGTYIGYTSECPKCKDRRNEENIERAKRHEQERKERLHRLLRSFIVDLGYTVIQPDTPKDEVE